MKKRASEFRPRLGPVFVNYSIDYVHFFHTSIEKSITWAGIMARKLGNTFVLVSWLKPAQKVAIRLRQKSGNRGLRAPKPQHEQVWEHLNRACPNMKELVFIFAAATTPMETWLSYKVFVETLVRARRNYGLRSKPLSRTASMFRQVW